MRAAPVKMNNPGNCPFGLLGTNANSVKLDIRLSLGSNLNVRNFFIIFSMSFDGKCPKTFPSRSTGYASFGT